MTTGATLFALVAGALVAATSYGSDIDSRVSNDVVARQFDYYDELDLKRYETLETEFGTSSRVFASVNAVRFGQLEVRAKLVVPRSDAPMSTGFFSSDSPEPIRIMLDYALVSCRHSCEVGVLTDPGPTRRQYKAWHDSSGTTDKSAYAASMSTTSMILIKGKPARLAIGQLNGSQRAHIVLIAAAHGVADFEFDTSVGSDTGHQPLPVP
jgi:hypothetical protein